VARGDQAALHTALQSAPAVASVQHVTPAGAGEPAVHRFLVELAVSDGAAEAQAREQLVRAVLAVGELRELVAARSRLDAVFRFLTAAGASEATATEAGS
jgi:hypothetical protein